MNDYLSARQAAAYCGVNEKTVRRWIAAGRIAAAQVDGQFRINAADLAPFVEERRAASDSVSARTCPPAASAASRTDNAAADMPHPAADIGELVQLLRERDRMLEERDRTIIHLSSQLGFVSGQLEETRGRLALLEARSSADPAPETVPHG